MKLEKLIKGLEILETNKTDNFDITGISFDSRDVKEGYVFVAIKGFNFDGHDYIEKAIENGAKCIVAEEKIKLKEDVPYIIVKDTRLALARLSSNYYNEPSKKMEIVGVTGTNGKTTVTYLIKSIFEANNEKAGIIGTIGDIVDGSLIKTNNTTPESLTIQKHLYNMINSKTKCCVMEVSSHSLDLKRVEYCNFDVGIFTNLSREHLDYHNTLEEYFKAKARLFYMTSKYNIVNYDDHYGKKMIENLKDIDIPLITYGLSKNALIYATSIYYHSNGVDFVLNTPKGTINIRLNIPGEFSVYNALAAASCGYAYGFSLDSIKEGLEKVEGVKGRFELVPTGKDFTVIIDFAHTPDGLEKVLETIDGFAKGRKVVVFGAGGNRDKTKRPIMGETVARHSDLCIVTSDNPRKEEPEKIIDDVLTGVKKANGNYIKIVDRKEAIEYAIKNAKPKDVILLAGKGHETYTIIGDKTIPFDERKIVLDTLKEMESRD